MVLSATLPTQLILQKKLFDVVEKFKFKQNLDTFVEILIKNKNEAISNSLKSPFHEKLYINHLFDFNDYDSRTQLSNFSVEEEEKTVKIGSSELKIKFYGAKVVFKKETNYDYPDDINIFEDDYPDGSYGAVEDDDVFITFSKPIIVKYIYIRPTEIIENSVVYKQTKFSISGYRQNVLQYDQRDFFGAFKRNYWKKIVPVEFGIDSLRIPRHFDFDNIRILHDSDFQELRNDNNNYESVSISKRIKSEKREME